MRPSAGTATSSTSRSRSGSRFRLFPPKSRCYGAGTCGLELFEVPGAQPVAGRPAASEPRSQDAWQQALAFAIKDLDSAERELSRPRRRYRIGWRFDFGCQHLSRDNSGNLIELVLQPEMWTGIHRAGAAWAAGSVSGRQWRALLQSDWRHPGRTAREAGRRILAEIGNYDAAQELTDGERGLPHASAAPADLNDSPRVAHVRRVGRIMPQPS